MSLEALRLRVSEAHIATLAKSWGLWGLWGGIVPVQHVHWETLFFGQSQPPCIAARQLGVTKPLLSQSQGMNAFWSRSISQELLYAVRLRRAQDSRSTPCVPTASRPERRFRKSNLYIVISHRVQQVAHPPGQRLSLRGGADRNRFERKLLRGVHRLI